MKKKVNDSIAKIGALADELLDKVGDTKEDALLLAYRLADKHTRLSIHGALPDLVALLYSLTYQLSKDANMSFEAICMHLILMHRDLEKEKGGSEKPSLDLDGRQSTFDYIKQLMKD